MPNPPQMYYPEMVEVAGVMTPYHPTNYLCWSDGKLYQWHEAKRVDDWGGEQMKGKWFEVSTR